MAITRATARRRPPTIIDVAERAGVSKSTVSNVLQGKVRVEDDTRDKVLAAIAELGYHANVAARYLRQRSHVLGVVVGDLRNPFHAEMAALVEERAGDEQHTILLATTSGLAEREAARVQTLLEHRVAAILFLAFSGDRSVLRMIPEDVPHLFVSFSVPGGISISVDERKGAQLGVEHLLELGHRKIAYVSTTLEEEPKTDAARYAGFRKSLEANGLAVDDRWVVRRTGGAGETHLPVAEELAALLRQRDRPTAVFAASDFTAVEVMQAADASGLDVPGDLSVVGFDDIAIASLSRISLTTVGQPMDELATRAVRAAIDGDPPRKGVRLSPRLIVRGSTAPPKRRARA